MANKINFITGETYTLAELFSGNRRIIIPDLQRDYCWGDETNRKSSGEVGELVSDFVGGLVNLYESKEQGVLNLGLFYGYEIPANHIQLCDGQQRLTTLFLLLGMLNKKCGKFRHHLISDYEYKHDDKEPYLNYAIRETSLYFLSDLVCRFFISNADNVADIKKADWYFSDYNLDPSIQSMLNALSKMESLLIAKDADWALSFGDWVLNKLTFLYFDMESRKNGEETFVVINTTGEPLSVAQNLKPLVIMEKNEIFDNTLFCARQSNGEILAIDGCWEQVETWFWQNRCGNNDTADAGFAEFLRWVYMIEQYQEELPEGKQTSDRKYLIQLILNGNDKIEFPYREIPFGAVYAYWKSLAWIYNHRKELGFNVFKDEFLSPDVNNDVNERKAIGQSDCFVILPVLKFVGKQIDIGAATEEDKRRCVRVYQFFRNHIRRRNVQRAVNSLTGEALKIIDLTEDGEIASILDKPNVSRQILTAEERLKLEILRYASNRNDIEEAFWKLQAQKLWKGEIMPVIKMSQDENGVFDFGLFMKYSKVLNMLFSGTMRHERKTHLLRRCVIASIDAYKPIATGRYYTFAWEWEDWNNFLSEHTDEMRAFFDYLLEKDILERSDELNDILEKYVENCLDKAKDFSEFAFDDYLLNFTNNSDACDLLWSKGDWLLCTGGSRSRHTYFFSRRNAYILKSYGGAWRNSSPGKSIESGVREWSVWYWSYYDGDCVVFEHSNVKFDVSFMCESCECRIELIGKNFDITPLAAYLGFEMKRDSTDRAIYNLKTGDFDVSRIKDTIDALMQKTNDFFGIENHF